MDRQNKEEVEDGKIVKSEIVDTEGQGHGALAGFLFNGGVDVLICGGIGGGARNALAEANIRLYPGAQGDTDAQVESFIAGTLNYDPDTVCSHHEHHDHEAETAVIMETDADITAENRKRKK